MIFKTLKKNTKKTLCHGGAANPNANRIGWKKRLPQTDELKSYCSLSDIYHGRGKQWSKTFPEVTLNPKVMTFSPISCTKAFCNCNLSQQFWICFTKG